MNKGTKGLCAIAAILFCALLSFAQTPPGPVASTLFGMHIMQPYDWPIIPFGGLGKGSGVAWAYLEPIRGVYDWTRLDEYVNNAQNHGIGFYFAGGGVPPWAAADRSSCHVADYGSYCTSTAANLQDLVNFMTALVTRYKGRIQIYELYNEPQNSFTGTMAQLVAFTQDEHDVIRRIDPAATILSPSTVPYGGAYLDSYFAAGGTKDINAVAMHAYPNPTNDVAEFITGGITTQIKTVMQKYGLSAKPLWDTESSWGYASKGAITDPDLRAAFVARSYLLHWSMGITRLYWYGWDNPNIGTLWNRTTGVSLAGIAYEQVRNWMIGATMVHPCSGSGYHSIYTCDLLRSGGYEARAVWNTDGNTTYVSPSQYLQYRDLDGIVHNIPADHQVTIGHEPILLENRNL